MVRKSRPHPIGARPAPTIKGNCPALARRGLPRPPSASGFVLGPSSNPQAPACAQGGESPEHFRGFRRMPRGHQVGRPDYLKLRVVLKKRSNHILLIPVSPVVNRPLHRIVVRKKDVVDVDVNTGLEPRKYFENE